MVSGYQPDGPGLSPNVPASQIVLTRAQDRVLRRVMSRGDNMHSDDLTRDLYPFVSAETVADSMDHLVKIGFLEVASIASVIGLYGYRPRRLLITQKGQSHIRWNPPMGSRLPFHALAVGLAGLFLWLPVSLIGVEYTGLVGFSMMVIAASIHAANRIFARLGA